MERQRKRRKRGGKKNRHHHTTHKGAKTDCSSRLTQPLPLSQRASRPSAAPWPAWWAACHRICHTVPCGERALSTLRLCEGARTACCFCCQGAYHGDADDGASGLNRTARRVPDKGGRTTLSDDRAATSPICCPLTAPADGKANPLGTTGLPPLAGKCLPTIGSRGEAMAGWCGVVWVVRAQRRHKWDGGSGTRGIKG